MAGADILLYGPDGTQFQRYGGTRGSGKQLGRTPGIAGDGPGADGALSSLQQLPFGTQLINQQGQKFRFAVAGAADLVVGNILEAAANVANHINLTAVASASGTRTPSVTTAGTAATADQYAGGYANVSVTPDFGSIYLIDNHLANAGSAVLILNLGTGYAIHNAWTTTSRVDLIKHPYDGVIQAPATTATGIPVGLAVTILKAYNTNGQALAFGWVQTRGMASALISGTIVLGGPLVSSGVAAGALSAALITIAGSTQSKERPVALAQILTATATTAPVFMMLE